MKRFYLILTALAAVYLAAHTQNRINRYEYWFDNDFASGSVVGVTPVSILQLTSSISTTGLSEGLHYFHIRFRDDSSRYSAVMSQFFHKIPTGTTPNKNLVAYEYWYDNNFAGKIVQTVSSQSSVHVMAAIPAATLSDGLHSFNIRFMDDQNAWSSVQSDFFHKIPTGTAPDKNLVAYEYWYDNNYSGKVTQTLTPQSNTQLITNISASSLSEGAHVFHIRFKDDQKSWSIVQSQFFYKIPNPGVVNNKTYGYRYWFDGDITTFQTFTVTNPPNPFTLIDTILTPILSLGNHTVNFQFKDSLGRWSPASCDTFNVTFARGGTISGVFTYNNSANTPLDSVWVVLKQNGSGLDSVRTNLSGRYQIGAKPNGIYTISARTSKQWNGINATDAVKVQRHFAGLELLTEPVKLLAADVNLSNSINGTDGAKIKRRFAGLDNSFARGDWTFSKPSTGGDSVIINGASVTQNFYGLCVGDVNGSYIPGTGAKSASFITLEYSGFLKASPGDVFEYPLRLTRSADVSAISLNLSYRNELVEILDVKTPKGDAVFGLQADLLKIAWSDINPMQLEPGEELLHIKMRLKETSVGLSTTLLSLLPGSELADANAIPIENLILQAPFIEPLTGVEVNNENLLSGLTIFPNPANNLLWVNFELIENADVTIYVYSILGPIVAGSENPSLSIGKHHLSLDVSQLSPGVYMLKFFAKDQQEFAGIQRIVISR